MSRETGVMLNTGMQGIGKSQKTLTVLLDLAYNKKAKFNRGSLIIDVNNEYGEKVINGVTHRIPILRPSDIIRYGNYTGHEVRRIPLIHPNGALMTAEESEELVVKILNQYRNGIILLEDLNKLYGDSLPLSISGTIINCRHKGIDVIINLQSIARAVPKILQNAKRVRFFYQIDSIEKSKTKLAGEEEIFYIAEKIVQAQYFGGNKHFFVDIHRDEKKIKGMFSNKMFSDGCMEYLSENPRVLRPLTQKLDGNGKKAHTYNEALMLKVTELHRKYNGNLAA